MDKKNLPVGSVVYLQEGQVPTLIAGLGQLATLVEGEEPKFFDYTGVTYPEGLSEEGNYYFNEENIAEVVFEGYKNDLHERYVRAIEEWKVNNPDVQRGNVDEILET